MQNPPVPDIVIIAYNEKALFLVQTISFPKPLDNRLLSTVAPAVAKAAMDSGVAREPITDWNGYIDKLNERLGIDNQLFRVIGNKARKKSKKKVVFAGSRKSKNIKDCTACTG